VTLFNDTIHRIRRNALGKSGEVAVVAPGMNATLAGIVRAVADPLNVTVTRGWIFFRSSL
jgi:hypothetical protein